MENTNTRSEEDKLAKAPIVVVLGGKEYEIKPLVIAESRPWRKHYAETMVALLKTKNAEVDSMEGLARGMNELFSTLPDTAADLFFAYAKTLNRAEIEEVATDQELADAFTLVISVAFPLVKSLMKAAANPTLIGR